jgi:hypothetical protein
MRIFKNIFLYMFILTFASLSCTQLETNKEYFTHLSESNAMYENARSSVYPNQNFIFLQRLIRVTLKEDESQVEHLPMTSASAIALKSKKGEVYAMTAGHWCNVSEDEASTIELLGSLNPEYDLQLVDSASFFGKTYELEILHIDGENDICVFKFPSEYSHKLKKIKPAKKYPRVGEKVYTSSAPAGMFSHKMRLHFEGYFAGCSEDDLYCFYSIPGTVGSSGSGILDSDGNLISILDVSIVDFNHITGGTRLEIVKELYEIYVK